MSDNQDIAQQLSLVLAELKEQRSLVTNLQEEVRGNNLKTSTEVKKLKAEKELSWKFKGNKIQFEFNEELEEILKTITWSIENNKHDYCLEVVNEGLEKIKKRKKKLIRIADTTD